MKEKSVNMSAATAQNYITQWSKKVGRDGAKKKEGWAAIIITMTVKIIHSYNKSLAAGYLDNKLT